MTTTFIAPDIECGGCANSIKKALGALPGVSNVEVNIETKAVQITHDEQAVTPEKLTAALDRAGFPVTQNE